MRQHVSPEADIGIGFGERLSGPILMVKPEGSFGKLKPDGILECFGKICKNQNLSHFDNFDIG
jgi:hypothetical protein